MKFLAAIGGMVLLPLLLIYGAFVNGFILYKACIWYFPIIGVHYILSFHGAIAIMLIFNTFTYRSSNEEKGEDWKTKLAVALLTPWFMLLVLWGFTFIL